MIKVNDHEELVKNYYNNEFENKKNQKCKSEKKSSEDHIAKVIGERRYLEWRLSASQRYVFLIKEA